jgi:hypothetical protein
MSFGKAAIVSETKYSIKTWDKQMRFVREYLQNPTSAAHAARQAGFKDCKQEARRLLLTPWIAELISRGMDKRWRLAKVDTDDVILELKRLAFANIWNYLRLKQDGSVDLDFSALTKASAAGIVRISVEYAPQKKQKRGHKPPALSDRPIRRITLQMADKMRALELLGKTKNMFNEPEDEAARPSSPSATIDAIIERFRFDERNPQELEALLLKVRSGESSAGNPARLGEGALPLPATVVDAAPDEDVRPPLGQKKSEPWAHLPDKPYFGWLFERLMKAERIFFPKSREMLLSWIVVGYCTWRCQFFPQTEVIFQSQKEDKVQDFISGRAGSPGYARTLYEQQDPWLRDTHPLAKKRSEDMPGSILAWKNGSILRGVPSGAEQIRQYHPTIVVFDEAAWLEGFKESYDAANPVSSQIIAMSSASPSSWFGDACVEARESGSERAPAADEMPIPEGCASYFGIGGVEINWLHYSADPQKNKTWVQVQQPTYSDSSAWRQEQEIDFSARAGHLVFPEFKREFTVIDPYPIPLDVTWWMAIDPHPRTPHAFLWMFVDRWDNHVYARDYWPSKAYSRSGNVPEDDDLYQIDDYVTTLEFLEGPIPNLFAPNGYTDNAGVQNKIYRRIMDPAGKAWASERHKGKDEDAETFWDTYRKLGISCDNAKKDFNAGRDKVAMRLRPRTYVGPSGRSEQSQILIFNTCKELIFQIMNCRYPNLTPSQAEHRDPIETPISKRDHMVDLMRYLEMEDPFWVDPTPKKRLTYAPYDEIPGFQTTNPTQE